MSGARARRRSCDPAGAAIIVAVVPLCLNTKSVLFHLLAVTQNTPSATRPSDTCPRFPHHAACRACQPLCLRQALAPCSRSLHTTTPYMNVPNSEPPWGIRPSSGPPMNPSSGAHPRTSPSFSARSAPSPGPLRAAGWRRSRKRRRIGSHRPRSLARGVALQRP